MSSQNTWRLILVIVVVIVSGYLAYPPEWGKWLAEPDNGEGKPEFFFDKKIQLGLDLQGGSEIRLTPGRFQCEKCGRGSSRPGDCVACNVPYTEVIGEAEIEDAIKNAQSVLELRLNLSGLSEPRIQRIGANQILVQMPGAAPEEIERIREILKKTGRLDFKLEADKAMQGTAKKPSTENPQGYAPAGTQWIVVQGTGRAGDQEKHDDLLVKAQAVMSGEDISSARYEFGEKGYEVALTLTAKGKTTFGRITTDNVGKRLAIVMDGRCVSAPNIQTKITDGNAVITGSFTKQQALDLATVLKAGRLKAPLVVVGEQYVGPTLGEDSKNKGLLACLIGFIATVLFMLIFYRMLGIIATVGLLFNVLMMLAILALFSATLTLPGIAGIVLTVAMAVDSNILVFERFREEQAKQKPIQQVFEGGFDRAWLAIFDSNITTFLAGLVLYTFGTGAIKGFATTLMVGIITTLFTAVFFSKMLIRLLVENGIMKQFNMMKLFAVPKIDYVKLRGMALALSVILTIVGIGLFAWRGKKSFSIEFNGGTIVGMRFTDPTPIETVRNSLQGIRTQDASGKTTAKYPDAEIQTVWSTREKQSHLNEASQFTVRVGSTDADTVKADLKKVFQGKIPLDSIIPLGKYANPRVQAYDGGEQFQFDIAQVLTTSKDETLDSIAKRVYGSEDKWQLIADANKGKENLTNIARDAKLAEGLDISLPVIETLKTVREKLSEVFTKTGLGVPQVRVAKETSVDSAAQEDENKPCAQYVVTLMANDNTRVSEVDKLLHKQFVLSPGPFTYTDNVGPVVAADLKKKAVLALVISWVAMIIYLAIRFQLVFGFAAVIALIHDVILTTGVITACIWLFPGNWGIDLRMGMSFVGALLTIVGYSVNDTVVIFDRIRENMKEMKREDFGTILNLSVNQTMSRTVVTGGAVLISLAVLVGLTAQSGGGVASFAFPMFIGTVWGTYSSVFIAGPVLVGWYRKSAKTAG